MLKFICLVLACIFLALAIIGVVVPGLPTVPFLLVAAWFSTKGSKRLQQWIYGHPILGKLLRDWHEQRAIPRRSKIIGITMLIVSWIYMYVSVDKPWVILSISMMFIIGIVFLVTRPEPQPRTERNDENKERTP